MTHKAENQQQINQISNNRNAACLSLSVKLIKSVHRLPKTDSVWASMLRNGSVGHVPTTLRHNGNKCGVGIQPVSDLLGSVNR